MFLFSKGGDSCGYFDKNGVGVTEGKQIAEGFCDFYCKVGPDLASRIGSAQGKSFKDYLGQANREDFVCRPTTP